MGPNDKKKHVVIVGAGAAGMVSFNMMIANLKKTTP